MRGPAPGGFEAAHHVNCKRVEEVPDPALDLFFGIEIDRSISPLSCTKSMTLSLVMASARTDSWRGMDSLKRSFPKAS